MSEIVDKFFEISKRNYKEIVFIATVSATVLLSNPNRETSYLETDKIQNTWIDAKKNNLITNNNYIDSSKKDIILCFDDCLELEKWRSSLELSDRLSSITKKPAHFSYYINSASVTKKPLGHSNNSIVKIPGTVDVRITLIQEAIDKGDDIGSHTVRHKHGRRWNENRWTADLKEFDNTIANDFHYNGKPYKSVGFRAPYLEYNNSLYEPLKKFGYLYDASHPGDLLKEENGLTLIGVPMYRMPNGKSILGMDYNWEKAKISDATLEQMLNTELSEVFSDKNKIKYHNTTVPSAMIISLHFRDWKIGQKTYFEVVSKFLTTLAKTQQYNFISMKEYVEIINKK